VKVLQSPGSPLAHVTSDGVAGATGAIAGLPDAMAAAALAGLNPVHGIYSLIVGGVVGACTTGSVFVSVAVTSAIAVAVRGALSATGEARVGELITLTLLVGAFQLVAGFLKLGGVVKFVSHSVMTGFLTGIGVVIVLSQLGDITGYASSANGLLPRAVDTVRHVGRFDPPTLIVGAATVALIVLFERLPIRPVAMLVALGLVAVGTRLLGWSSVALVRDAGPFPGLVPVPALPVLSAIPQLLIPALGIAVLGLVQTAGVSQSAPNPDGSYADPSSDFRGQGVANVAVGFLRGMPVGGSLSSTRVSLAAGAESRWANIFASLFVVVLVVVLGGVLGLLPTATLAGILVLAGARAIDVRRMTVVWRTGWLAKLVMTATLAATITLPLTWAIGASVALSFVVHLLRAADRVTMKELTIEEGTVVERDAPETLQGDRVTILLPRGSLFFAGVRTLLLPAAEDAEHAAVIFVMRGRKDVGSTFIEVISRYARSIRRGGGRLLLVGVSDEVWRQLDRTRVLGVIGKENVFRATSQYGEALFGAVAAANEWLGKPRTSSPAGVSS
jgi:sulfate permease, SulP family